MEKTLMSLVDEAQTITELIRQSGGELTEEIEKMLVVNESNMIQKVDNYKVVIDRLEMEGDYWKQMEKNVQSVRKGYESALTFLKANLKNAMKLSEQDEISGANFKFKLTRSKPKMVIDADKLQSKYLSENISYVPDKEAIQAALDSGEFVDGVKLEEVYAIRSFMNRGK